jgi:uncharacterized protein involved in exopolysaccharide biosynthesis
MIPSGRDMLEVRPLRIRRGQAGWPRCCFGLSRLIPKPSSRRLPLNAPQLPGAEIEVLRRGAKSVIEVWTGEQNIEDAIASLAAYRTAIRRNAFALLMWVSACAIFGAFCVALTRPDFIASARIVLQPRHVANDGPEDLRHYHQTALDGEQAETELQVLRSERILRPVFEALRLADAPEVRDGQSGFWPTLARQLHRLAPRAIPYSERARAFYAFSDRVRSRRLGLSYIFEVSYRAQSAAQAAQVANAIVASYLRNRIDLAIADAKSGAPYGTSRVATILAEFAKAEEAIKNGSASPDYLPDSDVRLLGSATAPQSKVYPKAWALVLTAFGIGLTSGLLFVVFFAWLARKRMPLVANSGAGPMSRRPSLGSAAHRQADGSPGVA